MTHPSSGPRPSVRFFVAASVLLFLALAMACPLRADAAVFTTAEAKCRDSVGGGGVKLARAARKAVVRCHRDRVAQRIPAGTDCNDSDATPSADKVAKKASSMAARIAKRCNGFLPEDVGYAATCPAPCETEVPATGTVQELTDCMICLTKRSVEALSTAAQGAPAVPVSDEAESCHGTIGKVDEKHHATALAERAKCQRAAERSGATDTLGCVGLDPNGKIAKRRAKAEASIAGDCGVSVLAEVDSCADTSTEDMAACVLDGSDAGADELIEHFYRSQLPTNSTTTTTTTTTTLAPQDPLCPETSLLEVMGGVSNACTTNADCRAGSCDNGIGRCRTVTELDTGWTGVSHNSDVVDGTETRSILRCAGPFDGGSAEPCGECTILGVDASTGSCRCANDNTAICDEPFAADADDCGGATCQCYLGPPLPISSGNTPVCVVNRIREDLAGTVNVDTGSTEADVRLAPVVHLGITLTNPCPHCEGDVAFGDGVRDGLCVGGANDGGACDAQAGHASFPAPGGDGHSLDCFPDPGKNISGAGLRIDFTQTTGAAAPITADLDCFFGFETCHCRVCSGNNTLPCASDADCAALGAGTCSANGSAGANTRETDCDGGGAGCLDAGGEEGLCDVGPDDAFCDGITRASGDGFIACITNQDCEPGTIGVDAGACTLTQRRGCFLPTVNAAGSPDPETPIAVATFCVPPTSNGGINAVAGLPGPARLKNQGVATTFCASAPTQAYTPGAGGCP